jgi:hypothetical protein
MLADNGPRDSRVAVRVAAVEFIFVIQVNRRLEGPRRSLAPFQNFFGPVHAHIVVHKAGLHHLQLRGIPQRIMRLRIFQLAFAVDFAWIGGVFGQALMRPRGGRFKVVIIRIEAHKVNRQLAADNQLFQIGFFCRIARIGFLDSQRDGVRTNVSEMQIGGKAAGAIALRLVALTG